MHTTLTRKNSVELRGFEPLTPSMRTRCATGLRYSPENLRQPSKPAAQSAHHCLRPNPRRMTLWACGTRPQAAEEVRE